MARATQKQANNKIASKRVTVTDIARRADVSKTTVSLVLSGHEGHRISEATCERVRRAAEDLGFIPSRLGKGFLQGNSRIVGAIMQYTQYSPWLEGYFTIQNDLTHAGYVAIALLPQWEMSRKGNRQKNHYISSELDALRHLLEYQIDGLLYYSLNPQQAADVLTEVERYNIPTVIMGNRPPKSPVDFVGADEGKTGRMAAQHLLSLGMRSFAVIEYDAAFPVADRRRNGFIAEVEKVGYACDVFSVSRVEELARWFPGRAPAGVFALNDLFAAKAVQIGLRQRWRMPEDLAVIGVGDITIAQYNALPLATINRHSEQIASQSVQLLLERIKGYDGPPRSILIPPTLVVRKSAESPNPRRNAAKTQQH